MKCTSILSIAALIPVALAQVTTIDQTTLDLNKAMWEDAGTKNYIFTYSEWYNGFHPDESSPWRTQVSSDQHPQQKKTIDKRNKNRLTGPSVEDIFAIIQDAITGQADYLKVFYDPFLGYPIRTIVRTGPNLLVRNIIDLEVNAYSPKTEVAVNRQKWEQKNLQNYNFELTQITNDFMTRWPLTIEVRNNAITSVKDSEGRMVNDKAVYTIDGFYDTIQSELDKDAPFVDIEYGYNGFPNSIFLVTNGADANRDRVIEYKIGSFDENVATPFQRSHLRRSKRSPSHSRSLP